MARQSDTKHRIQAVARELFARKGVQRTSLQEIADRLGITKPALYYHFSSRDELVRSIVQPLVDAGETFLRQQEERARRRGGVDPRALLEGYFDLYVQHHEHVMVVLTELSTLTELGLLERVMTWRERIAALLFGPDPTLEQSARAVVALGGLQDCTLHFPDAPRDALRRAAVDAALSALAGPDPSEERGRDPG